MEKADQDGSVACCPLRSAGGGGMVSLGLFSHPEHPHETLGSSDASGRAVLINGKPVLLCFTRTCMSLGWGGGGWVDDA